MKDIAAHFNSMNLGEIGTAKTHGNQSPVLATPATVAVIAGWKAVGAFAAGAGSVVGAYSLGRAIG
ncbi:hypothetical protein [Streptomyces erythrochromogenes]|uniref:hypothetical protein n=1 Tax=Streptomyces erythrochromogenes TaxID=285574 RepID=UPI0036B2C489